MAFDYEALAAGLSEDNKRQTLVIESCLKRIAELDALLSISRDLNRKYVDALRKVADHKAAVEMLDSAEVAMAGYSRALSEVRLIARQSLPITETR